MLEIALRASEDSEQFAVADKLRDSCGEAWARYTHHEFTKKMADGTLPAECFKNYLIQLYLFSKHYCRAYALAVVKSESLDDLREAAAHVDLQLNYEMALHVDYCEQLGIPQSSLEIWPEADAIKLYTRYVLDRGITGDLLDLLVALAPCSLGYADIGATLIDDPKTVLVGNPYRGWIELHGGPEFQEAAIALRRFIGRVAEGRGVKYTRENTGRWISLKETFQTATRLEIKFFDTALKGQLDAPIS